MRKKYVYKGEIGDLDSEMQQGLSFSDLSDVSSDSEAPQDDHWLPPSPRAEAKLQEDEAPWWLTAEEIAERRRNEAESLRAEATYIVRQERRLELRRQRSHEMANARAHTEGGLWTPEPSPRSRSPSPARPTGFTAFSELDEIEMLPRVERKIQFLRDSAAWRHRRASRKSRRTELKLLVMSRVRLWISKFARESPSTLGTTGEGSNTGPEIIWERRFRIHHCRYKDFVYRKFTQDSLNNISIEEFYSIYLTLPPQMQKLLNAPSEAKRSTGKDNFAADIRDPMYIHWEKRITFAALDGHRRRNPAKIMPPKQVKRSELSGDYRGQRKEITNAVLNGRIEKHKSKGTLYEPVSEAFVSRTRAGRVSIFRDISSGVSLDQQLGASDVLSVPQLLDVDQLSITPPAPHKTHLMSASHLRQKTKTWAGIIDDAAADSRVQVPDCAGNTNSPEPALKQLKSARFVDENVIEKSRSKISDRGKGKKESVVSGRIKKPKPRPKRTYQSRRCVRSTCT